MPKFLSSVAQAKDRDTVACLLDPIIDRPVMELEPSPGPFRRIINMAVLCGVNQFQTYLRWADYEPAVYRGMCEYIGRLAAVLRGARSAATVAMYYPIETFQSEFLPSPDFTHTTETPYYPSVWRRMMDMMETQNTIARSLLLQGIDFNWLHGDWIEKGKVEKGCLIAANGRYRTIVMPEVELLPLAVARKVMMTPLVRGRPLSRPFKTCLSAAGSRPSTGRDAMSPSAPSPPTSMYTKPRIATDVSQCLLCLRSRVPRRKTRR
jgi:hypothetical protein